MMIKLRASATSGSPTANRLKRLPQVDFPTISVQAGAAAWRQPRDGRHQCRKPVRAPPWQDRQRD
jgi:hypothetical protein